MIIRIPRPNGKSDNSESPQVSTKNMGGGHLTMPSVDGVKQEPNPEPQSISEPEHLPFNVPGRNVPVRTVPTKASPMRPPPPTVLQSGNGYAKLQDASNPKISFLLRGMNLVLGRKTSHVKQADIHLGSSKHISRLHCLIEYNFVSRNFQCTCLSKNGMKVNGVIIGPGADPIVLHSQSLIEIGNRQMWFLLPCSESENEEKQTSLQRAAQKYGFNGVVPPTQPTRNAGFTVQPVSVPVVETVHASKAPSGRKAVLKELHETPPDLRPSAIRLWPTFLPKDDDSPWRKTKDRPPYQYFALIVQALAVKGGESQSLQDIFAFIEGRYPFYSDSTNTSWRSSIRHNLSMNECFLKVARKDTDTSKNSSGWMLSPDTSDEIVKQACHLHRKTAVKDGSTELMDTSDASKFMSESIKKRQEKKNEQKAEEDKVEALFPTTTTTEEGPDAKRIKVE